MSAAELVSMQEVVTKNRSAIRALCLRHKVKRLSAFGSVTTGDFQPGKSDIDFLVEFEPVPLRERANQYFSLLEDLERLFSTRVDLIEPSSIHNPYLWESIEESLTALYEQAGRAEVPA